MPIRGTPIDLGIRLVDGRVDELLDSLAANTLATQTTTKAMAEQWTRATRLRHRLLHLSTRLIHLHRSLFANSATFAVAPSYHGIVLYSLLLFVW